MWKTRVVEQIPIEWALYGRFVTYKELRRIMQTEFGDKIDKDVNVFIDLFQFLTPPHQMIRINNYFVICSVIINYCAHIKKFFRDTYGVNCNTILIASNGAASNNTRYLESYMKDYHTRINAAGRQLYDAIQSNYKLINLLAPYLPGVYFKPGTVEAALIIKGIIDQNLFPKDNINIAISTSQFMYQLPAFDPSIVVIRQKRKFKEELSFSYNFLNCLQSYIYDSKGIITCMPLDPKLITMVMLLSGIPKLNVKAIVNINTALNIVTSILPGAEHDPMTLYEYYTHYYMKRKRKVSLIDQGEFIDRFMAIDITYQYKLYQNMPEYTMNRFMNRLNDPETLEKINAKYFGENPINLVDLQ